MKFSTLRYEISWDHITPWLDVMIPTKISEQPVKILSTSANISKERQNHWSSGCSFWKEITRHGKELIERAVRAIW